MQTAIFKDEKHGQCVVLPDEMRFTDNAETVHIHQAYNSFFLGENKVSDDFSRE